MAGKNNNQQPTSTGTRSFTTVTDKDAFIRDTLTAIYSALAEKGYNPASQLVGYFLSEDPTYITNHKNARSLIRRFDRDELLDALIRYYFSQKTEK